MTPKLAEPHRRTTDPRTADPRSTEPGTAGPRTPDARSPEPDTGISRRPRPVDTTGRSYPAATPRRGWWRPLVAVMGIVVGYLVLSTALTLAAFAFDGATGLTGDGLISPAVFLANNLGLAALIPISLLLYKWLYGPAHELHSVTGRFRWKLFGMAALIVVPVWVIQSLIGVAMGEPRLPSPVELVILGIVLLTTPLQAAGEEYAFRGLLSRAFTTWGGRFTRAGIILGMVLSSAAFMLVHFAFQPLMLLYFFTFGASLAVIAWRTGGLEVPVLVHVVHNVTSFASGTFLEGQGIDALATRGQIEPGAEMLAMAAFMAATAAATWAITAVRPVVRTVPAAAERGVEQIGR